MKKVLFVLLAFVSISVFAQDMNIFECTKKAKNAAYALAQLELGEDCIVVSGEQDSPSTQMTLSLTVRQPIRSSGAKAKKLVYEVQTIDKSEADRCVITNVKLID